MHHRPLAMATARMCNSTAIAIATILLTSLLTTTADAANHVSIREDTGWIAIAIYPEITGSTKVDQLAREKAADITHKDQHDFIVWAKDDVKANGKPDSQYSYQSTPTITIDAPKLVSVLWTNESDIGGEHPTTTY